MRRIKDHRFDEDGFSESIRTLVKSSPWWMISLVVHLAVLLALWSIRIAPERSTEAAVIQAPPPETPQEVEDEPPPEIEPDRPEETVREDPVPEDEQPAEDPTEDPFHELKGDEGLLDDSSFTTPFHNTSIGIGPGAGSRRGKRGGSRKTDGSGSSGRTENAVELGLVWLAKHQDLRLDGRWDCDDFAKHDPPDDRCDGPGGALYDVGVTGLSLLAFLGAGYTDRGGPENPFAENVRAGLRYLITVQDEDGCFGARSSQHFIYNHAIASLAMAEAYWMTRNPRYRRPAQDGLDFIGRARNPYLAWRYEPRGGENDMSVTGWMVMALKSGKFAGLTIDPDAFDGARLFVEKMTDPEFGQVGYTMPGGPPARPEGMQDRFPPEKSQSMTAVGLLTRIFLGEDPRSAIIQKGADLCMERLPVWRPDDGSVDMYYWYYGTLALFQVGGRHWRRWNEAMKEAIVGSQHRQGSGRRTGSWDPVGPWGHDGGRVYATACMVMCLEVYYRYDKVIVGSR